MAPDVLTSRTADAPLRPVSRPRTSSRTGPSFGPVRCTLKRGAALAIRSLTPGAIRFVKSVRRRSHHDATAPASRGRPRWSNAYSVTVVSLLNFNRACAEPRNSPGRLRSVMGVLALLKEPSSSRPRCVAFCALLSDESTGGSTMSATRARSTDAGSCRAKVRTRARPVAEPPTAGSPALNAASLASVSARRRNTATRRSAVNGEALPGPRRPCSIGALPETTAKDNKPVAGGSQSVPDGIVNDTPRSASGAGRVTSVENHGPRPGDSRPRVDGSGLSTVMVPPLGGSPEMSGRLDP